MVRRGAVRRDRRLTAAFGALAVGSLAFAGWHIAGTGEPPEQAYTEIQVVPKKAGVFSIAIAGDTMFGDGAAELIEAEGVVATLTGVSGLLRHADVAVVNLEAPITDRAEPFNPGALYTYASPPEAADALAAIGVTVLQLGNNHTMDRGGDGLADTIENANRVGMVTVGAGADRTEAVKPVLIRSDGFAVALVSLGEDYGAAKRSDKTAPGMVPFSADAVIQAERIARQAGADRVIALVHWGVNYEEVTETQHYWAAELSAAGYDAIIGTGSHFLHPVEVVDGVPTAYSIGNFVFGALGRFNSMGRLGLGAVATISFDADGGTLTLQCLSVNNRLVTYVPRECDAEESALAAGELQGGLVWQGSIGTLTF